MAIKAYSYVRFSTLEQAKGDSLRRQIALSEAYIENNKDIDLVLDDTLQMTDVGVSAFRGKNIEEGRLGAFLDAVKNGKVNKGSYLLIENFDRLSRERVSVALRKFLEILEMGVIIITLSDNKKYDDSTLDTTDLIISLTIMARAHEESVQKGKRIKESWGNKKKLIHEKKLTKWSPMWLDLSENGTEFIVNQDRADIVKQIFEWAVSGLGTILIIKRLEGNSIKPWDLGKIKRKKRLAKHWHSSLIQRFFSDRTVLGEYKLRKSKAKGDYEIIKGYYPQIIDDDLFYRAKEARESRNVSNKGGGRKGKHVSNLFAKLVICGYSIDENMSKYRCAGNYEAMIYVNKGKKYPYQYLQCNRIRNGNIGCDDCRKMWRYDYFETSFLTHVKDIDVSVLVESPDDLKQEIEQLEEKISSDNGRLIANKERIKGIESTLEKYIEIPKMIVDMGNKLESDQNAIEKRLESHKQELKLKKYEFDDSDQRKEQLSVLIDQMRNNDGQELFDLRLQLSDLLKKVIDRIEVYAKGKVWDKELHDLMRLTLGDEGYKITREVEDKNIQPFYIVVYKSGEKRYVTCDPKDPKKLNLSMMYDDGGVIEIDNAFNDRALENEREIQEIIMRHFNCSTRSAEDYIRFLPKEKIDEIVKESRGISKQE